MNPIKFCLISIAALGLPGAVSAQVYNGDFENSSPLAGWSTMTFEGGIQAVSGGDNISPFTSPYGQSRTALKFTDGPANNASPRMQQNYAASGSGAVRFSFDFKLSSPSTDYWVAYTGYANAASGTTYYPYNVRIGEGGDFKFITLGARFTNPITFGSWYHVNIDLDFNTQQISGSLTPYGDVAVGWQNYAFIQPIPYINSVEFGDAVTVPAKNGDLYLDNVSVTKFVPVPEASTYGCFAILTLFGVVAHRRCKRLKD